MESVYGIYQYWERFMVLLQIVTKKPENKSDLTITEKKDLTVF